MEESCVDTSESEDVRSLVRIRDSVPILGAVSVAGAGEGPVITLLLVVVQISWHWGTS